MNNPGIVINQVSEHIFKVDILNSPDYTMSRLSEVYLTTEQTLFILNQRINSNILVEVKMLDGKVLRNI